jgi:hypothetical protein
MKISIGNCMKLATIAIVFVVFLPLQGCPIDDVPSLDQNALSQQEVTDSLIEGQVYEAEIQILADGTLYAAELDQEGDEDEGEAEFSAQVDSVAADCSSFVVLGGLTVVLDGENEDDDEEEGENNDEEDGDEEDGDEEDGDEEDGDEEDGDEEDGDEEDGDTDADDDDESDTDANDDDEDADDDDDEDADDDDDQDDDDDNDDDLGICDLTPGMWIEAAGVLGDDGVFQADEIKAADDEEIEIDAALENLGAASFTMIGLTIAYDGNTVVNEDGDDDDDENDGDDEDGDDEDGDDEDGDDEDTD